MYNFLMNKYLFILVVLPLLALAAAPAQASTNLVGPGLRPWMERCLERSRVPTPPLTVTVNAASGSGKSTATPWRATITIADPDIGDRANCQVLMHEIGHIYDWTTLTAASRQKIACSIFREPSANPWWGYYQSGRFLRGGEGSNSPLERFAEAYALTAVYKRLRPGSAWLDGVEYVAYDLDRFFDRRRFDKLRRYLRSLSPSADTRVRDQRQPLSDCS